MTEDTPDCQRAACFPIDFQATADNLAAIMVSNIPRNIRTQENRVAWSLARSRATEMRPTRAS